MVKYVADSSIDIYEYKGENFESVPLVIYTDENEFLDDGSINIKEMLDKLEKYKGRSYTACPGTEKWLNAFEGGDEIYVVTITSGLSGTYNSAMVAKEMYQKEYPEAKIEVFDSLSTGPEMEMAIEKIVELKQKGMEFEDICEAVKKYLDDVHLFFVLGSVHNLAQNGRVNKVVASAVGVLGINILGFADEAGTIKQVGKCRGEKKVVSSLMSKLDEMGYKGGKVRICHVENEGLALKVQEAIKERYKDADIEYYPAGGLCSYYAERGGIIMGFE